MTPADLDTDNLPCAFSASLCVPGNHFLAPILKFSCQRAMSRPGKGSEDRRTGKPAQLLPFYLRHRLELWLALCHSPGLSQQSYFRLLQDLLVLHSRDSDFAL